MASNSKKLDRRLQLVADMVPYGSTVVDVGTDHGWLPVHLVREGKIPFAIASDLRPGPLSHARCAVEDAGLEKKIHLRLSDGLDAIDPKEASCVVMAGMGGILITQLLEKAPWLKDPAKTLVLQPMTDAPLLRSWLGEQGFSIVEERATGDKRHCYTVIRGVYDGNCRRLSVLRSMVGKLDDPLDEGAKRFLEKEAARLQKQIKGLKVAGKDDQAAPLVYLWDELTKVINGGVFR